MSRRQFLKKVGLGTAGLGLVGAVYTAGETRPGGVYYLGPDGSDTNSGSAQDPWFTVSHAATQVAPGDTIRMLDGTYEYGTDVQRIDGVDGSRSRQMTLTAAEGATPTLVWSGEASGWENTITEGLLVQSSDWWTITGLEFRDSRSAGLQVNDSANCTLRHLDVHHNGGMGILHAFGTPNTRVTHCDAHHNGTSATARTADGFVFNGASGSSAGTVVTNCRSWANAEDGFDCWDGYGITFRRCQAFNNGRPDAVTPAETAMGMGFKLGGGDRGGGNRAERCLAWGNYYTGFSDNIPARGCAVVNCTAVDNGFTNYSCHHGHTDVINCIDYRGDVAISGATARSNTWNLGIDDPGFVSSEASSPDFLHLADGSPCVDAGVDAGVAYHGTAPDLGAIESDSG